MRTNARRRFRGLIAVSIGALVVIAFGCVGFIEVSGSHDAFSWWAEIFIPALVGMATVVVSYAAFVASRRATDLAHELEKQRERGEQIRSAEDRKRRLQDMALAEARALTAWAVVAMNDRNWKTKEIDEVGESQHGPSLEHQALVLLQQSIVPGARELFDLTEFEVKNFFRYKPDQMYMPDRRVYAGRATASSATVDVTVPTFRRRRVLDRIRGWALDPEAVHSRLAHDHLQWLSDPAAHMDYRQGQTVPGLPALSDLEVPPRMNHERIEFFTAKGLMSGY